MSAPGRGRVEGRSRVAAELATRASATVGPDGSATAPPLGQPTATTRCRASRRELPGSPSAVAGSTVGDDLAGICAVAGSTIAWGFPRGATGSSLICGSSGSQLNAP